MRDDRERLLDIIEAILRVEKYAAEGRDRFEQDELVQIWVVHHMQTIGEAVAGLSDDLRKRHPEVHWSQIVAMRNILVHAYFNVALEEVWLAVERDVPVLKAAIQAIIEQESK